MTESSAIAAMPLLNSKSARTPAATRTAEKNVRMKVLIGESARMVGVVGVEVKERRRMECHQKWRSIEREIGVIPVGIPELVGAAPRRGRRRAGLGNGCPSCVEWFGSVAGPFAEDGHRFFKMSRCSRTRASSTLSAQFSAARSSRCGTASPW